MFNIKQAFLFGFSAFIGMSLAFLLVAKDFDVSLLMFPLILGVFGFVVGGFFKFKKK